MSIVTLSHRRCCSVFIVNVEKISQIVLVFPFVDIEQVNADWVRYIG